MNCKYLLKETAGWGVGIGTTLLSLCPLPLLSSLYFLSTNLYKLSVMIPKSRMPYLQKSG